ncbi:hypothetical protein V8G54_006000 [Vigna mungo]|uniref:Uncharacterized protein n=1 Tax=Vigna mungo TaxID=3915 RepID=A0AAQ3S6X0_VIGMU
MAAAMAKTLFSWSGEDTATAAWWRLGAGSTFLFLGFLVLFLYRWMAKWIWGICFLVCSAASDCSVGKKRKKERQHLDGNSGVVEASPINIAPISTGLQPEPLGEVVAPRSPSPSSFSPLPPSRVASPLASWPASIFEGYWRAPIAPPSRPHSSYKAGLKLSVPP